MSQATTTISISKKRPPYSQIDEVKALVAILDPQRSDNYRQWMEVGWCLHNINHNMLLDTWISFSKKGDSFQDGECEALWDTMRSEGLGIGSLHMWAKSDSPYDYRCIINRRVFEDIKEANGKHNAVAAIAHKVLKGRFVCAAANNKLWYEFDGNLWKEDKEAINLRHQLSTTVRQHYIDVRSKLKVSLSIDDLESNESRTNPQLDDLCSKLLTIAFSLQDVNFKDGVVKEMREYFYDGEFLKKLDSKINLIAFTNGVWDLENKAFRHAQPEDFVSLSVGFEYNTEVKHELVSMVETYWQKLHPDHEQRNYVIKTIARQLYGDNGHELFHIHAGFQGAAGNGKTKFFEVLEGCLGDYVRKFPVQVLTAKCREEAGKPAPEYQYWKGRRILYASEPKDDDILHSGIMKDLTGGEQILYRLLFSNEVHTFRPQYKMHIMCNDPPKVDGSDEGVRRRIRKIDYISRFVNQEQVNESEHYYIRDGSFFEQLKNDDALKMETLRLLLNAFDKGFSCCHFSSSSLHLFSKS